MDKNTELYNKLLEDLKEILFETKTKAEAAVKKIIAKGYWEVGKRIAQAEIPENENPQILASLAQDLNIEPTNLGRSVNFFLCWPESCPVDDFPNIAWSHYRALLSLPKDSRTFYLDNCEKNKWNVRLLTQKIKDNTFENEAASNNTKTTAGTLTLKRRENKLHVYKAAVDRVIDGDTLDITIDLGFDVWTKKRLRLRGINCSEMKDPDPEKQQKAIEAKEFVEKCLPKHSTVVIQTFKVDLHGRFVADVFFEPNETDKEKIFAEGTFLNQLLLDNDLAEIL